MLGRVKEALSSEKTVLSRRVKTAAETLYRNGAVLEFADDPSAAMLLGDLQWSEQGGVLAFAAYGEGPRDARHLRFDHAAYDGDATVWFSREGRMLATLRRIEDAEIEDPQDYRIAWQLWQQVAPLRRNVIDNSYTALGGNGLNPWLA